MSTAVLELTTSDGVTLAAHRRAAIGESRADVVVVHGFAASRTEGRVTAVADALHAARFTVLTFDSRGHGASGGESTLGDKERHDVAAAVDAAGSGPTVLVGASMGAIGALRYATGAASDRLTGVVTISCPARWTLPRNARGVLSALMTQTPVGRWCARRYVGVRIAPPASRPPPPIDLVGALHVPLAIIHGRADPFIPVADAQSLDAAANDPHRLALVDGMGHAFESPALEPIVAAVEWVLEQGRPGTR